MKSNNHKVIIDKGVPIPAHGRSKYPWRTMDIGDSFIIPKLTVSMGAVNDRYHPKYFIVRKCDDGYRVWRTADKPTINTTI